MEGLRALIPLLLTISLGGLVLAVGLHRSQGDLLYVLKRPPLLAKAILAVLIIPPAAASILVAVAPIKPVVAAGILMMAISPVPPLVPGKQLKIGGRREYAYGVYTAMALLTIVSVPMVEFVVGQLFGRDLVVPWPKLFQTVAMGVLLPLGVGGLVSHYAPAFAARAWRIVYIASMVLVLLVFVPILVKIWPALMSLIGDGTLVAMALITAISLAGGHLLGGPDPEDRATLAVTASVRHPGIAIALAGASFRGEPKITAAVLLFMLVGLVVAIPYQAFVKRRIAGHHGQTAAT